ncbi:hypothetical protein OAF42_01190 [Planctomicrobium sp.]|nr:DUF6677 family protein [Planctomicrobium sp.]MDB4733034.1 hypothetical protein [Planctomicrobium sp.]
MLDRDRNHMTDSRINLKNPVIAGVLAYLIPGAGHFYQGRKFKAVVYFVCILGLFFSGMAMADWKAVQLPGKGELRGKGVSYLKYAAQLGVGIPSLYGIVQRERYDSEQNQEFGQSPEALATEFWGEIELRGDQPVYEEIRGTVDLAPHTGNLGDVSLTGTLTAKVNGKEQTFQLAPNVRLGKKIKASEYRALEASILRDPETPYDYIGNIRGVVPRPFRNWYQVPMDEDEIKQLHGKLGKFHELAMVFTWIAGLLNVLAIWDAVEGPAYGYDDEHEKEKDEPAAEPAVAT